MKKTLLTATLLTALTWQAHAQPCNLAKPKETFQGTVESITHPIATLKTPKEKLVIRLGPFWFWQTLNQTLSKGEKITVKGVRCGNMIIPWWIKTPKGTITLRDKRGFPMWRRRGAR